MKLVQVDVVLGDFDVVATFLRLHGDEFVALPDYVSVMIGGVAGRLTGCRAATPAGDVTLVRGGDVVRVQRGEGWDAASADFYDLSRPGAGSDRPFQQIEVKFDPPARTRHYGRSGTIQGRGVSVESWGGEAHLVAVSSRGRSGAARLAIPYEYLDDVIAALTEVRNARQPTRQS